MKLQVGKTYVTRDGRTAKVTKLGSSVACVEFTEKERIRTTTDVVFDDGRMIRDCVERGGDLIAESEPPAEYTSRGGDVVRRVQAILDRDPNASSAANVVAHEAFDSLLVGDIRALLAIASRLAQQGGTKPRVTYAVDVSGKWLCDAILENQFIDANRGHRMSVDVEHLLHHYNASKDAYVPEPAPTADRVSVATEVCDQLRPGAKCESKASCRDNGCNAVERELLADRVSVPREATPEMRDAACDYIDSNEGLTFKARVRGAINAAIAARWQPDTKRYVAERTTLREPTPDDRARIWDTLREEFVPAYLAPPPDERDAEIARLTTERDRAREEREWDTAIAENELARVKSERDEASAKCDAFKAVVDAARAAVLAYENTERLSAHTSIAESRVAPYLRTLIDSLSDAMRARERE